MLPCGKKLCVADIRIFFLKALYLLKDICKLAQNVFLQALKRGDAAGERQNREIQYMKDPEMFSVLNLKKKRQLFQK